MITRLDSQLMFKIRRLFPMFALVKFLLMLIVMNSSSSDYRRVQFKTDNYRENSRPLEREVIGGELGDGNNKIYFIETSGAECLRPRQACAVESAALANPDMAINLYMASNAPPGQPEIDDGEGLERHCATMDVIRALPNVNIVRQNLTEHLMNTPYLELLIDELAKSEYAYQHLSDAVRVALLYRYGGIYLDLDNVVLRSLRRFRNAVGHIYFRNLSSVENGLMAFDSGHRFLKYFMRIMYEWFAPEKRSSMGPLALTRAFRNYCKHPYFQINDSFHEHNCHKGTKLNLFNSSFFYAIGYDEKETFFKENFTPNDLSLLAKSYSVHVYGSAHGAHVPETSLFAYLARRCCPNVYRLHERNTYVF